MKSKICFKDIYFTFAPLLLIFIHLIYSINARYKSGYLDLIMLFIGYIIMMSVTLFILPNKKKEEINGI